MKTVEMRKRLREAGKHVPRSNEEVIQAYQESFNEIVPTKITAPKTDPVVKLVSSNIYTYIGHGDSPPHMIKFMGIQNFVRGQPTEVNNLEVLAKLKTHKCFVRGSYDMDLAFDNDAIEREKAEKQRLEDIKTNNLAKRIHGN